MVAVIENGKIGTFPTTCQEVMEGLVGVVVAEAMGKALQTFTLQNPVSRKVVDVELTKGEVVNREAPTVEGRERRLQDAGLKREREGAAGLTRALTVYPIDFGAGYIGALEGVPFTGPSETTRSYVKKDEAETTDNAVTRSPRSVRLKLPRTSSEPAHPSAPENSTRE